MSSDQKVSQKEKEKEDPGLAEFKEVALKTAYWRKPSPVQRLIVAHIVKDTFSKSASYV